MHAQRANILKTIAERVGTCWNTWERKAKTEKVCDTNGRIDRSVNYAMQHSKTHNKITHIVEMSGRVARNVGERVNADDGRARMEVLVPKAPPVFGPFGT